MDRGADLYPGQVVAAAGGRREGRASPPQEAAGRARPPSKEHRSRPASCAGYGGRAARSGRREARGPARTAGAETAATDGRPSPGGARAAGARHWPHR